jgi:hypothetical protein
MYFFFISRIKKNSIPVEAIVNFKLASITFHLNHKPNLSLTKPNLHTHLTKTELNLAEPILPSPHFTQPSLA